MNERPPINSQIASTGRPLPNPLQCIGGSVVASSIAVILYRLTIGIAALFAKQPTHSDNLIVQRITAAVRTMFVGMSALGTGIFALAGLGLFGLGMQILTQRRGDRND